MTTTLFVDFVAGTITDAPLGDSATTFNSAALANLPEVTSGERVKITFNAAGVGDAPEIAYITAHTALATSATITRGQEGTAGTEWAASTTWNVTFTADDASDLRELGASAGDIKSGIWTAAPTGWLLLDGSAVVNADTNYPDLWAVVPAAWQSGTTLNLPDMTEDRVVMGGATLGDEGGANTHTLSEANLPPHDHDFSDTSTSALTTHDHSFSDTSTSALGNHDHTFADTSTSEGNHNHNIEYLEVSSGTFDPGGTGGFAAVRIADAGSPVLGTNTVAAHTHDVSGTTSTANLAHTHVVSGTTGAENLAHTHDVSGTTTSVGSGTAVDHTPAHLRVNWAIKF